MSNNNQNSKADGFVKRYLKTTYLAWKDAGKFNKYSSLTIGLVALGLGALGFVAALSTAVTFGAFMLIFSGAGMHAMRQTIVNDALNKNVSDAIHRPPSMAANEPENLLSYLKSQDQSLYRIWQKPLSRLPAEQQQRAKKIARSHEHGYFQGQTQLNILLTNGAMKLAISAFMIATPPFGIMYAIAGVLWGVLSASDFYRASLSKKTIAHHKSGLSETLSVCREEAKLKVAEQTAAPYAASAAPVAAPVVAPVLTTRIKPAVRTIGDSIKPPPATPTL